MSHERTPRAAPLAAALATLLLAACAEPPRPTAPEAPALAHGAGHVHAAPAAAAAPVRLSEVDRRRIQNVRLITKPFNILDRAKRKGWSVAITPCMSDPALGGMGFHYGNPKYIDGTVQALFPEVLLYEPQRNGSYRLVGVEYIVPFAAWTRSQPPRLFGQNFSRNETFQVWALHMWIWRTNPNGLFADWNPKVSCP